MRRHSASLALVVAAVLVLAGACGSGDDGAPASPSVSASSAGEIRLGMTNDLAGVGKTPYGAVTKALQAYFAKVNQEDGGVCGREIAPVVEDDQYSAALALEKTKKLVEQDQVLAVLGAFNTTNHQQVAPYLNDPNGDGNTADGVPDLFLSTGWSGWGDVQKWPWTIGYIPDYTTDARVQARYVSQNFPGKTIGILYENDAFGQDYLSGLKGALADPALLVSEQPYDPLEPDIGPQLLSMQQDGVEVVFLATIPEFTARAIFESHSKGYRPQFAMSYVNAPASVAAALAGGNSPAQLEAGFKELEGTLSTAYLLSAIEDVEDPAMREHQRIMGTYDGPPVSSLSVYAQSLGELAVETLKRSCDNLSRGGVLRAAELIQGFRPSLLAAGIEVDLGPQDHLSIQALQPVQVRADGTLKKLGEAARAQ
ncbi:MAG: ABC transporter substrate-binding protein [Dehalococcoidia bacterium]|nr:ABC transporter substrate-binding protein [Dehalococcoidia bacterium]